ncbi:MAG: hypothetical protein KC503_24450 [Myxococcales bacterium]|nr:hypothetical protein [Myxococcales bacterium]
MKKKSKTGKKKKKLGASLAKVNMLEERMAPLMSRMDGTAGEGGPKPPGG